MRNYLLIAERGIIENVIIPTQTNDYHCNNDTNIEDTFDRYDDEYDNYNEYGSEYEGTYAHDIAGLDDDAISDAFEGDPDAYWNID